MSKMSYSVGGQAEDYAKHREHLLSEIRRVNELLAMGGDNLDEPWEEEGLGVT